MFSYFRPSTPIPTPDLVNNLTHYGFLFEQGEKNIDEMGQYGRYGSVGVLCTIDDGLYLYTKNLSTNIRKYIRLPKETVQELAKISKGPDFENEVRNILYESYEVNLLTRPTIECMEEHAQSHSPCTVVITNK